MTKMKRISEYLLSILSVICLAACSGTIDPEAGNGSEIENGPENVPEGVLRIFADKTQIKADGSDEVTFTVMLGSEDVSTAKTLQIIREYNGEEKYMAYGANKFSTVTPGTFKFTAKYYYGGNHYTDNSVTVEAEQFFTGEEKAYQQRVLGTYFTSTGCTSCPLAAKAIKELQDNNPGKISVVAFHADMDQIIDPMTILETHEFKSILGGFTGLPAFFFNMKESTYVAEAAYNDMYAKEIASYSPQCGVSIQTAENGNGEYTINIGITSNTPSTYRYLVFLVEDGIVADQTGDPNYVHQNVVRAVLTEAKGDKLNDNLPFSSGVEVTASKKVKVNPIWNLENMRVIVAATVSSDGGYNFAVNNVAECKLGESVDYQYAE